MPRVYSRSQGRIIEEEEEQALPTQDGAFAGVDPIKQFLGIKALGKKQYGTAATLLTRPEPSEADKKINRQYGGSINLINQLEGLFTEAGGGSFGTGIEARIKGGKESLKGMFGYSDAADTYNDARQGFATALKTIVGEVGQLTDKDYRRMTRLIPRLGSTPGEAIKNYDLLRSQIAAVYGMEAPPSTLDIEPTEANLPRELMNLLFPTVKKYVTEDVPEYYERGRPETYAEELKATVGLAPEALGAALEAYFVGKAVTGVARGVTKIPQFFKGGGPRGALGRGKMAATKIYKTTKVSGDDLFGAVDEYAQTNPLVKRLHKNFKPILKGKDFSIEKITKLLPDWGRMAYTKTSTVKGSAQAGYLNVLYGAAREQVVNKAPEVAKYIDLLRVSYKLPQTAQKALWQGIKITSLGKLLGL